MTILSEARRKGESVDDGRRRCGMGVKVLGRAGFLEVRMSRRTTEEGERFRKRVEERGRRDADVQHKRARVGGGLG